MAVYVDNFNFTKGKRVWCHMVADTEEELHTFAAAIGLKKSWCHVDHYDVTLGMKAKAIAAGAIEITPQKAVLIRKRAAQP